MAAYWEDCLWLTGLTADCLFGWLLIEVIGLVHALVTHTYNYGIQIFKMLYDRAVK